MSRNRWEQIHRFFTINGQPRKPSDSWWFRIDPILSTIRSNCQQVVTLSLWVSINEIMVAFQGRSIHKIKALNKPIKEGYKTFALTTSDDIIVDWLMYLNSDKIEEY